MLPTHSLIFVVHSVQKWLAGKIPGDWWKTLKIKCSPICGDSALAKKFTNHLLKDSLVNVQICNIDFLISPTVRYSLWLTFDFHSQNTESFNINASWNQLKNILFYSSWQNQHTSRSTFLRLVTVAVFLWYSPSKE